jgi:hypothetical protein
LAHLHAIIISSRQSTCTTHSHDPALVYMCEKLKIARQIRMVAMICATTGSVATYVAVN